jgi:hypothetical protein
MAYPSKGRADYLALGDNNAVCAECGRKRKASELKKHWQGYWVCPEHWEARQPQDFVRAIPEKITPPWTQPMPADSFVTYCTMATQTAYPGFGGPGCMKPSYVVSLKALEGNLFNTVP